MPHVFRLPTYQDYIQSDIHFLPWVHPPPPPSKSYQLPPGWRLTLHILLGNLNLFHLYLLVGLGPAWDVGSKTPRFQFQHTLMSNGQFSKRIRVHQENSSKANSTTWCKTPELHFGNTTCSIPLQDAFKATPLKNQEKGASTWPKSTKHENTFIHLCC